jgi:hypothetical protein
MRTSESTPRHAALRGDVHNRQSGRQRVVASALARSVLLTRVLFLVVLATPALAQSVAVQPPVPNRVVVAALANANSPSDLDFQGGECEIDSTGTRMDCGFQQVFLTISPLDAQTCLVTTNQYARRFQKQNPTRWVSSEGPEGECGLLDVATLEDEGNMVHWSL